MKSFSISFFLMLFLFFHSSCHAQWEKLVMQTHGLNYQIYSFQNIVMLATDSGLVFSEDKGNNWQRSTFGSSYPSKISSVTSLGDQVFACNDSGIFVSKDCREWTRVLKYITYSVCATNTELISSNYGGETNGYTAYASSDTGKTWKLLPKMASQEHPVASAGPDYYINGEFVWNTTLSIYKNGAWKRFDFDSLEHQVRPMTRAVKVRGKVAAVAFRRNGPPPVLAYSGDKGETWSQVAITGGVMVGLEIIDTMLIFGNSGVGISLSHDRGQNWTKIGEGLAPKDSMPYRIGISDEIFFTATPTESPNPVIYRRKVSDLKGIIYNGNGQLQAPDFANATYSWYLNDVLIEAHTSRRYQATKEGRYTVEISYPTPNARAAAENKISFSYLYQDIITENSNQTDEQLIKINSSGGLVSVHAPMQGRKYASISNALGQIVTEVFFDTDYKTLSAKLNPGIYLIKVLAGKSIQAQKFLVE